MPETKKVASPNDHLANERTYLAWIRTSIGIMAFGFVVVKFSIFVRQFSLLLGKEHTTQHTIHSDLLGISFVIVGALMTILSYLRYQHSKKQLESGAYQQSSVLIKIITLFIFLVSVLLIVYLIQAM
jgi:putative membrane protein